MTRKTNFIFLKFLALSFALIILFSVLPLMAFGKKGPHTHVSITKEAFIDFTNATDWDLRADCMELIVQGNLEADSKFMNTDSYHCDNNNILGCADRFRTLKDDSNRDPAFITGLMKLGQALHIAQDFYSHSNWVENFPGVKVLAPLEHPWLFTTFPQIQTGYYNLLPVVEHTEEAGVCFTDSKGNEDAKYHYATHACLNKDSGDSFRGKEYPANIVIANYHEWAGVLAREHTSKILIDQYKTKNPHLLSCLVPSGVSFNCGVQIYDYIRPD